MITRISMASMFEKKQELLTDYDVLLMIEEDIRGGICHAVHRYAKAK